MRHLSWILALCLVACDPAEPPPGADEADTDTDTDTDADSDADTDTDNTADADGDGASDAVDCDDADPDVFPGAPDVCGDDRVTDCDRLTDDGLVTVDGETSFLRLADALAAATSGAEIVVCAGTHVGTFEATVPVRLRSHRGAGSTFLAGDGATTLTVPGGSAVVGFTVRDGRGTQAGGGIRMSGPGTLLLEDTVVSENRAPLGGGVFVAADGEATLVNTRIEGNTATDGGGGIAVERGGSVVLDGTSEVRANEARWFGGGVWLDDATLTGGTVTRNELTEPIDELLEDYLSLAADAGGVLPLPAAALGGGGVALAGEASVVGTTVNGNVGDGGGVSVTRGAASLVDTAVTDNTGHRGGGLLVIDGTLALDGTTAVTNNAAVWGAGGALYGAVLVGGTVADNTATDEAGGLWVTASTVRGTTLTGNEAGSGGGVYADGRVALDGVTLRGNVAEEGGGFATHEPWNDQGQALELLGCTVEQNTAGSGAGGSVYSDVTLVDTRVADNVAGEDGGGLWLYAVVSDGPGGGGGAVPHLAVVRGAVVGNTSLEGGGGVHVVAGTVAVEGTDFGTGADDNLPFDVTAGGTGYGDLGAGVTFGCDAGGCTF